MYDDLDGGDRCVRCGRGDVDDQWLWLQLSRIAEDVDCEFDEVDLSFCSQEHAAQYLAESEIEWEEIRPADRTGGVRADLFMFGCGLLAIVLSVIGLVALLMWIL